jgi:peptide chain release factor
MGRKALESGDGTTKNKFVLPVSRFFAQISAARLFPFMPLPLNTEERLSALGLQSNEVDERFVRGAGPGGQKINKTSSTVWLRHRPTGVEVRCQRERSQAANRELAWTELCEKLEARAKAGIDAARQERELARRRVRQKSRGQKARMIETKKHRAKHKSRRGRVRDET